MRGLATIARRRPAQRARGEGERLQRGVRALGVAAALVLGARAVDRA